MSDDLTYPLMRRWLNGWTPRPRTFEGDALEIEVGAALAEIDRLRALAGQLATSSHWWESAAVRLAVELLSFPGEDIDPDAVTVAYEVLQRAHDDGEDDDVRSDE